MMSLYHNFFIHSSVELHLECLHNLSTINGITVDTGLILSKCFLVSVEVIIWF